MSRSNSSDVDAGALTESLSNMRDLVAIDLPCLLKNYKKGIEMCGGYENIKNTIKSKSSLIQMKLNPKADPLRHHIVGQKEKSVCLLLKLTRKKSTLIKAEVMGRTSESYCFHQCADYQFLSAAATPACRTIVNYSTGLMIQGNSNESVIETIPRPFAKCMIAKLHKPIFQDARLVGPQRGQTNNNTTTKTNANTNNDEEDYLQKRRDKKLAAKAQYSSYLPLVFRKVGDPMPPYINYSVITKSDNPAVTTAATAATTTNDDNSTAAAMMTPETTAAVVVNPDRLSAIDLRHTRKRNLYRKKVTLAALERIFSHIPILARRHLSLHPHLQKNAYMTLEFIPKLTYCYREGAYKGLLVRRGYDPEAYENRNEARFYQILTVRVPLTTYKLIQQRVWICLGRLSSYKRVDLDTLTVHDEMITITDNSNSHHEHISGSSSSNSNNMNDNNGVIGGGDDLSGSGSGDKDTKSVFSTYTHTTAASSSSSSSHHHNSKASGRKTGDDYVMLSIFGSMVKRQFSVQLCNIKDESLLQFIRSVTPQQYFSDAYGWFSAAALALMREKLMKILVARVDAFVLSINTAKNASITANTANNNSNLMSGNLANNSNSSRSIGSSIPPKVSTTTSSSSSSSSSSSVVSSYDHDDDDADFDDNNNANATSSPQTPEDILDPYRWASRYVGINSTTGSGSVGGVSNSNIGRNNSSSNSVGGNGSGVGSINDDDGNTQDGTESNYYYDDQSTSAAATTITRQSILTSQSQLSQQTQSSGESLIHVPEEDEMEDYVYTKQRSISNFKKRSRSQLKNQLLYSSIAVAAGESGGTAFGINLNNQTTDSNTSSSSNATVGGSSNNRGSVIGATIADIINLSGGQGLVGIGTAGLLDFNRVNTAHISGNNSNSCTGGGSGRGGRKVGSGSGRLRNRSLSRHRNNSNSSGSASSNNSSSTSDNANLVQQSPQLSNSSSSSSSSRTATEKQEVGVDNSEYNTNNYDDENNNENSEDSFVNINNLNITINNNNNNKEGNDNEDDDEGHDDDEDNIDEEEDDDEEEEDEYLQASIDSAAAAAILSQQDTAVVADHDDISNSDSEDDDDDT